MWIILSFTDNEETANHKTIAAFNPAYEKLNKRKLINVAKYAQVRDISLRLMRQGSVIYLMAQGNGVGMEHQHLTFV